MPRTIRIVGVALLLLWISGCSTSRQPLPSDDSTPPPAVDVSLPPADTTVADAPPTATPPAAPTATPAPAFTIALPSSDAATNAALRGLIEGTTLEGATLGVAEDAATSNGQLRWAAPGGENALLERHVVPVVPFATVSDEISAEALRSRWQSNDQTLLASSDAAEAVATLWGAAGSGVQVIPIEGLQAQLEATPDAVGLVTFGQLDPRFKVLTLDGVNILSNQLADGDWPLVATLQVEGERAQAVRQALSGQMAAAELPATDRDPAKLTTLIMTGVTAMARDTAAVMERTSDDYPALMIAEIVSAADITHVSNEIPFLDDCVVNATENNLQLCSHTDYWATLAAIGTDIVGLSGNHVNDFGYDGAERSITWYRENNIPIYGSGLNEEEACAPLLWEDHGNRFAFVAALAYEPSYAWATDELPGACYYYNNKEKILALVKRLSEEVNVVSVELQHTETYEPYPIDLQIEEFRELREAGADIVTGVQSHVPQAAEPYGNQDEGGAGIIMYGLGNLFFDQMFSWETRSELLARHTIYDGKLLNTEILTAALENYAQPRWTSAEERADILTRIFDAAPPRP